MPYWKNRHFLTPRPIHVLYVRCENSEMKAVLLADVAALTVENRLRTDECWSFLLNGSWSFRPSRTPFSVPNVEPFRAQCERTFIVMCYKGSGLNETRNYCTNLTHAHSYTGSVTVSTKYQFSVVGQSFEWLILNCSFPSVEHKVTKTWGGIRASHTLLFFSCWPFDWSAGRQRSMKKIWLLSHRRDSRNWRQR